MSAPTMKREWTKTNLLRDVLAAAPKPQIKEPTYSEYCVNECFIAVTDTCLVHMEWDRAFRCWFETEGGETFEEYMALTDKLRVFQGAIEYEIARATDIEMEAEDGDSNGIAYQVYSNLREERLANARGGIRPMSATPTVSMSDVVNF